MKNINKRYRKSIQIYKDLKKLFKINKKKKINYKIAIRKIKNEMKLIKKKFNLCHNYYKVIRIIKKVMNLK